ncbi:hypothetical protein ABMA28_001419 [Loxostege sticticalis]|uniref:FLYWCH-type domain-containing protein n=1 Tax=Loxostege sticticalis TaxID=481309 RepID=A0ABD0T1K8_LOXSC
MLVMCWNRKRDLWRSIQYELVTYPKTGGRLLVVNGYTFSKWGRSNTWVCSKYKKRCLAKVKIEIGTVFGYQLEHNHTPPTYHISKNGEYISLQFRYINSNKKGHLVMISGYTFSNICRTKTWVCSSRYSSKCKAKVKVQDQNTVVPCNLEHNHPPPKYHIAKDGKYLSTYSKIWMCSNRISHGCEAKIKMEGLARDAIKFLKIKNKLNFLGCEFKIIDSPKGGRLIMINGYTFSKLSTYSKSWICSNRFSYKCEAKIKMEGLERVTESHLDHNHPPPKYYVTQEGKYVKIH